MSDIDEHKLKEEELRSRKGIVGKGTLTLTEKRLLFSTKGGLFRGQRAIEVPLEQIVNVRAKKAFGAGEDHLEIDYVSAEKKERLLFSRFSLAQWASSASSLGTGGAMGRLEANSLSSWEDAITDARLRATSPRSGVSELDDLEKLAALKEKGIVTEEEFQEKKKQILGF